MNGILFKPKLIKQIAAGEKDVTRRLGGLKEINLEPDKWKLVAWDNLAFLFECHGSNYVPDGHTLKLKPRYHIGEVVFIREAWATIWMYLDLPPTRLPKYATIWFKDTDMDKPDDIGRWRSPLHLPARFARHFIQITDVSSERLQDITDEESLREGCPTFEMRGIDGELHNAVIPTFWFESIWNSINPDYPFDSNPWVFRYAFKHLPNYKYEVK